MDITLQTAANGHLTLNLNGSPESSWVSLSDRLLHEHGFKRRGQAVAGIDATLHQDFERSDFKLLAGRDNWSGHYLLAECAAGDDFLRKLYNDFGKA